MAASGVLTISGLADGTEYFLHADLSGDDRYMAVRTADAPTGESAIVDAKGDLLVGTAADTLGRRAVGANGQVLTADSAEATGVKWAAASGGAGIAEAVQGGQAGMWALPGIQSGQVTALVAVAQTLYAVKFTPARNMTLVSLKVEVSSLAAGADLDGGILDAAGARLGSSGAQADLAATTGVKTLTFSSSVAVTAGTDYYACVLTDAAPQLRAVAFGAAGTLTRFGSTAGVVDAFTDSAHGTSIQASATVEGAGGGGTFPLLTVHE